MEPMTQERSTASMLRLLKLLDYSLHQLVLSTLRHSNLKEDTHNLKYNKA